MPYFHLPVTFSTGDPMIINKASVVEKIPVLSRSMAPGYLTQDTIVLQSVHVPFPREAAQFLFQHVEEYEAPRNVFNITESEYAAAFAESMGNLRDIIELANYFECHDLVKVIGYVISKKMSTWTTEEIANFMGVQYLPEGDGWVEEAEWHHPDVDQLMQFRKDEED